MLYIYDLFNFTVEYVDVDTKDLTTRYANDVIASCAFGLKVNSHTERDNQFFTIAKKTAYLGFRTVLIFLGYYSFPAIMRVSLKSVLSQYTKFLLCLGLHTSKGKNWIRASHTRARRVP